MTSSNQTDSIPATEATAAETSPKATAESNPNDGTTAVTREQADQIINELKSIKQNIFWLLLVAGFFAARSFFFHY